jgi:methanesulfonate monooxygenase subunit beta
MERSGAVHQQRIGQGAMRRPVDQIKERDAPSAMMSGPEAAAFVSRSCLLLDREEFSAWMALCAPEFRYRMIAYSTDLLRDMCWLDVDHGELEVLFGNLRSHVRVLGTFFRHAAGTFVEQTETGARFVTSLSIFHTTLQGETSIFAVCRYFDQIEGGPGSARLVDREVRLDTRLLNFGPHVIL